MPSIEEALAQYPRENLTRTPTPLQRLDNLSAHLDVNFYIKRDDLTDLALGGDKPRKLEYEIAKARAEGADTLVTCGSAQSNHCRLTAAAAHSLGMECHVVMSSDRWQAFQGNLLTVYLMGANVKFIETEDHWELEEHVLKLCGELRSQGRKPYYIPVSGSTPLSCLGYVRGGLEILSQLSEGNVKPDVVYTPFGTGGTYSAMMMTFREKGHECPFIGISVNGRYAKCMENLDKYWNGVAELLRIDPVPKRRHSEVYDEFIGEEYGDPTEAALDAILLMAKTEGILLDPVYSGKVFSGFLKHHGEGRWQSGQTVLFLHSGGVPALFAYHKVIEAHLRKRGVDVPDFGKA